MVDRNLEMKEQFITFMQKIFNNDHAELAPPLEEKQHLLLIIVKGPKKSGLSLILVHRKKCIPTNWIENLGPLKKDHKQHCQYNVALA